MKNIKYCWKELKEFKILFFICIIIRLLSIMINLSIPLYYSSLITSITNSDDSTIITVLVITASLIVTEIFFSYLKTRMENKISREITEKIRIRLLSQLLSVPHYKIANYNDGKLFSLINTDSQYIAMYIFTIVNTMMNITNIIGIGIIIFNLNWQLSLLVLIIYPVIYIINNLYGKMLKRATKNYYIVNDSFINFYKTLLNGLNEIKNQASNKNILDIFTHKTSERKISTVKSDIIRSNHSLISGLLGAVQYLLILIFGAIFVTLKRLTIGNFVAFASYSKNFSSSLSAVISLNATLQPANVVLERIKEFDIIFNDFTINDKQKQSFINGDIEITDAYLQLNGKLILNNLNMFIKQGQIVGLIGKNGQGKSTIAKSIIQMYLLNSGEIKICGENINKIRYYDLQKNITYVNQHPVLQNISIINNILLFDDTHIISKNKIIEICKMLNIYDDIIQLPKGFDTIIGEHRFSVGQNQKIQLARALLKESSILILDEITANLDSESRNSIYNYIKMFAKNNRTILYITHSESEYNICDVIYEIDDGNVVHFIDSNKPN